MDKTLQIGIELDDNTMYVGDQGIYHVRPQDGHPFLGAYRKERPVLNTAFYLKDKKNITLDFHGATLMLHGKIQPFVLEKCKNITIKNVTVVHDRASFTEMTVVELGKDYIKVKLNPHHPCRVEDGKLIPVSEYWENTDLDRINMFMQSFDAQTREGLGMPLCMFGKTIHRDPKFPFTVHQYVAEQDGDFVILRGPVHSCFRVGCIIAIGHERRLYSSVLMLESENIHLDCYRVLNGAGMGIMPIHTKDIFLNKVEFMYDDKSEGIISNQADAVHSFACSGRFDIIDCVFEGMIDDALNIHSQFYTLDSTVGNHMTIRCRIPSETTYCTIFDVGDRIGVHKGNTTEIEQEYVIVEKHILDTERIDIALDRVPEQHTADSLVENLSAQSDITMVRSRFRKANSHLRFQSSGRIRIEDCEIGLPMLLTGDAAYWFESSGVHDMLIQNTSFTADKANIRITPEVMPSEKEPYYHKNIRVQNCRFVSDCPVTASYTDNIIFQDNLQTDGKTMTLKLLNCGEVQANGCNLERRTEKKNSVHIN